ncbi:uncharacterized protein E0L32_003926 [Thyridium curvatum]|uniref:Uncharacterized protein n=1 Tax=Thyridium curvatum TaxID=1093900 RepID=A0A507B8V8_9PEZI|nr:uncharacterized protein E0L32_003926 [Thyridium curvatum]TPX16277.1 hypothetical protein E0L32_003926 [Thyridium curvatum]
MWDRSLHGLMMTAGLIADPKMGTFLRDSAFNPQTCEWEGLKLLISRMYTTQRSYLEDQGDSIKDKAFPPELDRILPQLELAWTQGKLCDAGVGLAMKCLKKASGRDSTATLGLYLSHPERVWGEKGLHMDLIKGRLVRSTTGKVVFATDEGQLGLGNDHIKLGDEAWIFPGTETVYSTSYEGGRV